VGYKWNNFKMNVEMFKELHEDDLKDVSKKAVNGIASGIKKGSKYVWDHKEEMWTGARENYENKQEEFEKQILRAEQMSDSEIEIFLQSCKERVDNGQNLGSNETMLAAACKKVYRERNN